MNDDTERRLLWISAYLVTLHGSLGKGASTMFANDAAKESANLAVKEFDNFNKQTEGST